MIVRSNQGENKRFSDADRSDVPHSVLYSRTRGAIRKHCYYLLQIIVLLIKVERKKDRNAKEPEERVAYSCLAEDNKGYKKK